MYYIVDSKTNNICEIQHLREVEACLGDEAANSLDLSHLTVIEGVKREIHINVSLHLRPSE